MQITDVSLVMVTDQFLAYVEAIDQAEPDLIADFAGVATRLVLLKSRSLLPRPPSPEDEEETSDLARELIEYRAVKEAAQTLAERDRRGEGAFARALGGVATPAAPSLPKLAAHDATWLARASRRRLTSIPSPRAIMHARPMISIREMVERVLHGVPTRHQAPFSSIARECRDRHELRTAFLAVLILIRRRVIDAEQSTPFGEISLSRVTDGPNIAIDESIVFAGDD
ncbi:MAG: segregation/condensation protein A [Thermomicrobiales bacterium]|nr:segregation/condensation protein A [Thermomicrobiales bacterium]